MPQPKLMHLASTLLVTLLVFTTVSRANDIGLLWKAVSPGGTNSYLFGAMHTDDARANDFSPALLRAIADSEFFVVEILPGKASSMVMRGKKLSDLLSEEEYDKVQQLADYHVIDRDVANRTKPWLLAIQFDQPKPSSIFSQDILLRGIARDQGKPLLALEDNDRHFETLDSLSMEEQLAMLRAVLQRSQEDKERDFEALLSAYLAGDLTRIAGLDEQATGDLLPAELWQKMRIKLLDERNAEMARRIIEITSRQSAFISVGASHLAGSDGLLQRLRGAGYVVTPLRQEQQ